MAHLKARPGLPGFLKCSAAALALLAAAGPLGAQDVLPYLEVGAGEKQGDFGTPIDSRLALGYATYGAATSRWDASVTVPWLSLDREGDGASQRDQGMGDVLLRGAYRILPENVDGWSMDALGALTFPSGSVTKGLGTGSTDLGGFLALHHRDGAFQWNLMGGWVLQTPTLPSGATYPLNPGAYMAGLGGEWYLGRTRWGLSFEARGALYQGTPGARELSADWFHLFSADWAVKAVVTAGLNNGAPRQGVGVAVIRYFH